MFAVGTVIAVAARLETMAVKHMSIGRGVEVFEGKFVVWCLCVEECELLG